MGECRVNLKDLKKQDGVLSEYLRKGSSGSLQLSELAASTKVSEHGGVQGDQTIAVECPKVENHALDLMKAAEDYSHIMMVAEEGPSSDTSMSKPQSRKLQNRQKMSEGGRTQTADRISAKQHESLPPRAGTCPRKMLDKGLLLKHDELTHNTLKKVGDRDEDNNEVEPGRKGDSTGTSSPLSTTRLRSRQSKGGSIGEDANEGEREEYFFLLWNKFLANKVVPGAGRLRQHLPSILKSFRNARAGQINQHALFPQALQHVSNLEEEGLLSKEAASKLMVMLQEIIKF